MTGPAARKASRASWKTENPETYTQLPRDAADKPLLRGPRTKTRRQLWCERLLGLHVTEEAPWASGGLGPAR